MQGVLFSGKSLLPSSSSLDSGQPLPNENETLLAGILEKIAHSLYEGSEVQTFMQYGKIGLKPSL